MEIKRYAHSSFRVKGKNTTLIIDPYNKEIGFKPVTDSCDILLTTHFHADHCTIETVKDYKLLIQGPGEYECNEVFVLGIDTYHDNKKGTERGKNTVYVIEIDGFTLVHLGDLGHELNKDILEKIPSVDILMIPVGGVYTINAEVASRIISTIEPKIVVPMHYQEKSLNLGQKLDGLDKFLDEMGEENPEVKDKLSISKPSDISDETKILILDPQNC